MPPTKFAWLFDNQQSSDVRIKISAPDATTSIEIYGHTTILASSSQYFKVLLSSSDFAALPAAASTAQPNKKRRTTRKAPNTAGSKNDSGSSQPQEEATKVISLEVESGDLIPAAQCIIKYMYSEELPGDSLALLLKMAQLGDKYQLVDLVEGCGQKVLDASDASWDAGSAQAVFDLPPSVTTTGRWPEVKARVASQLVKDFIQLEHAMRDEDRRELLTDLSLEAVKHLLAIDELVVMSENAVMFAAVTWLRGDIGSAASKEERREVFGLVRLLRLTPTYQQVVMLLPEAKELMTDDQVAKWAFCLSACRQRPDEIEAWLGDREPTCSWNRGRRTVVTSASFCTMEIYLEEMLQHISVMDIDTHDLPSGNVVHNGVLYTPGYTLQFEPLPPTKGRKKTTCTIRLHVRAQLPVTDTQVQLHIPFQVEWEATGGVECGGCSSDSGLDGAVRTTCELFEKLEDITKAAKILGNYADDGLITLNYIVESVEDL